MIANETTIHQSSTEVIGNRKASNNKQKLNPYGIIGYKKPRKVLRKLVV